MRAAKTFLVPAFAVASLVTSAAPAHAAEREDARTAISATPTGQGYWVVNRYGHVVAFGDARPFDASPRSDAPVVAADPTPTGDGLWLASADGGVFTLGDASFVGSAAQLPLNAAVVDIESTPDGAGYWLLAADGGVFPFGDAAFLGSAAGVPTATPFVAIESTVDGSGYWLRRSDGAVYPYGAASNSLGPASVMRGLRAPIVDMAAAGDGGHWLAAGDGGVFAFGPPFYGSAADIRLNAPITAIAATPSGDGYWLLGEDGGIFTYGDANYRGSAVDPRSPNAIATTASGDVLMEPGGACWSNPRGGVCSSSIGPGPSTPRLTIARGQELTIRYLIDAAPITAAASTTPWATDAARAFAFPASNPATVTIQGPSGDYLLAVSATWDIPRPYDHEGGDASYYIRIRVP